ncbi:hypothetical protein P9112_008048 [Eukaryota sp. TZLM1-RC]
MPYTFDMFFNTQVDFRTLNVRASEDTKVRADWTCFYHEKTQAEVAEFFLVNQSTISRWIVEAFEDKDDDKDLKIRGKIKAGDFQYIKNVLENDPLLYLIEIAQLLKHHRGKTVFISCIHRALVKMGYTHKRCKMLVRRTKTNLIKQFENKISIPVGFILQYKLVFIDEVSFRGEDFTRRYGWSRRGKGIVADTKALAETHISACVAINQNGFLHCNIQYGHFNRLDFVLFIADLLRINTLNHH